MEKMTDYLKKWREVMPSWLANYRPGDHVEFSDFMGGRIGYYPGSFFDGNDPFFVRRKREMCRRGEYGNRKKHAEIASRISGRDQIVLMKV